MNRLEPPDRATLAPAVDDLLTLASDPSGTPLGTVAVLAHRPQLLGPFLGWAAALALEGSLAARDHEALALRAAFRCGSAFEWDEHVLYARRAGMTDEEIAALRDPANQDLLVRAADALVVDKAVDDELWASLAASYDAAQLVEILYVVGQYTMLSMVANGLGL